VSELQIVQPNTWTPLLGTDVEVLFDGAEEDVRIEADTYRNDHGEHLVEFSIATDSPARIVLRAPKAPLPWPDDQSDVPL
jgi:hypothetical protein